MAVGGGLWKHGVACICINNRVGECMGVVGWGWGCGDEAGGGGLEEGELRRGLAVYVQNPG